MAPYWGISAERAKEMVNTRQDVKEDIVSTIIRNKVLDNVIEKASISDMEPSSDEQLEISESGGEEAPPKE